MSDFQLGQRVKLKDDVARELEATIGSWNNEFSGLVGVIGRLEASTNFPEMNDWIFTTDKHEFGVNEDEIEAVQS